MQQLESRHAVVVLLLAFSAILAGGAPKARSFEHGMKAGDGDWTTEEYWRRVLPPGGIDAGTLLPQMPPFQWDISNVEATIDVPGVTMVNNIPVKMRSVVVKGRLDEVMREVYASFIRQGLVVMDPAQQPTLSHHEQLTGLDPTRFITYTVMARPIDDKRVSLVLGEANIGWAAANKATPPAFAPAFPGAEGLVTSRTEGLQTMTFSTRAAEAEVRRFYDSELPRGGFKKVDDGVFRSEREEIRLLLKIEQGRTHVLLSARPLPRDEAWAP